jgi:hypothetical protein
MHSVCVSVWVGVTVNDMKIPSTARQCLYGKIILLATTYQCLKEITSTNWHSFHALHTKVALQQKYVNLHMAF